MPAASVRVPQFKRGDGDQGAATAREGWPGADHAPIRRGGVGAGMSTSGGLLIGVDIGGTFTDVVVRRPDAADPDHEDPEHPQRSQPRGAAGARAHGYRLGLAAATDRPFRARHHGCDQRRAGAQGRPRRLDHHRRFPRRARDRPPDAPPDVRSGARSGDADVSGARPLPPRGSRARQRDRRGPASRSTRQPSPPRPTSWSPPARGRSQSCSCSRSSTTRTSAAPARSSLRDTPTCSSPSPARSIRPSASTSAQSSPTFDAYVKPVVDRYLANLEPGLPRPAFPRRCRSCSRAAASPARRRRGCARFDCSFRGRPPA